ncbi:type IV secretion system protein [Bartonella koehlerae]|uniref:Type IV secretion system protein virB5 n=1 Tax=Bartonella koehlerae C-29 TaxID=1134510 RepID=A0A067W2W6_9HYPH|nr:hypothetical protein O9A_01463 [Bartonella koehlerae C-29]
MKKLIMTAAISVVLGIPDKAIAMPNQILHSDTRIEKSNVEREFRYSDLPDDQLIRALTDDEFRKMIRDTFMNGPQIGGGYGGGISKSNEPYPVPKEQKPILQPPLTKKAPQQKQYEFSYLLQKQNTEQEKNTVNEDKNLERITEKIHNSITGNRTRSTKSVQDDGSLLFPNPQHIYDQDKRTGKVQETLKQIMQDERQHRNTFKNTSDARTSIDTRSQYAAVIDKVVALQTFKATENRFEQIAKMLTDIDRIQDLKGIAELQVRMKGMLAVIQNEATKLQMVAHLRNSEQALINRLKRQRNIQILGSSNKTMPAIRSQSVF